MTNTFLTSCYLTKIRKMVNAILLMAQQRISTTIIFLDILRTKFKEIAESTNNNDANDDLEDINAKHNNVTSESKREQYLSKVVL